MRSSIYDENWNNAILFISPISRNLRKRDIIGKNGNDSMKIAT